MKRLALVMLIASSLFALFMLGMKIGMDHVIHDAEITGTPDGVYYLTIDGQVHEYT